MFRIRIYLRERLGTHNLRKLMHVAGVKEAVNISARSFHREFFYVRYVSRNGLSVRHYAA